MLPAALEAGRLKNSKFMATMSNVVVIVVVPETIANRPAN